MLYKADILQVYRSFEWSRLRHRQLIALWSAPSAMAGSNTMSLCPSTNMPLADKVLQLHNYQ
jgi:hypothetical protein